MNDWDPVFAILHDQKPNAGKEVDVHEKEKDHLGKLHTGLNVLLHIQECNDFVKPQYSSQLQNTEQLVKCVLLTGDVLNNLINRNGGK